MPQFEFALGKAAKSQLFEGSSRGELFSEVRNDSHSNPNGAMLSGMDSQELAGRLLAFGGAVIAAVPPMMGWQLQPLIGVPILIVGILAFIAGVTVLALRHYGKRERPPAIATEPEPEPEPMRPIHLPAIQDAEPSTFIRIHPGAENLKIRMINSGAKGFRRGIDTRAAGVDIEMENSEIIGPDVPPKDKPDNG